MLYRLTGIDSRKYQIKIEGHTKLKSFFFSDVFRPFAHPWVEILKKQFGNPIKHAELSRGRWQPRSLHSGWHSSTHLKVPPTFWVVQGGWHSSDSTVTKRAFLMQTSLSPAPIAQYFGIKCSSSLSIRLYVNIEVAASRLFRSNCGLIEIDIEQ